MLATETFTFITSTTSKAFIKSTKPKAFNQQFLLSHYLLNFAKLWAQKHNIQVAISHSFRIGFMSSTSFVKVGVIIVIL